MTSDPLTLSPEEWDALQEILARPTRAPQWLRDAVRGSFPNDEKRRGGVPADKLSPDQETALNALSELKSIHQAIGDVGQAWRRCKPGTKRFMELKASYDKLMAQSWEMSDKISNFVRFGFCG